LRRFAAPDFRCRDHLQFTTIAAAALAISPAVGGPVTLRAHALLVFWFFVSLFGQTALADSGFSIGMNFVGADRGDVLVLNNDVFTRSPAPDVNGGVGPDHVVMFIKGAYRVWDKRTGQLQRSINDVQFWNTAFANNGLSYQTTQTAGPSDPRILFDRMTNRWYAIGIDRTGTDNGVLNVAVTAGADPSVPGAWRAFTTPTGSPGWQDFPTLGLDERGLHISSSVFAGGGGYLYTELSHIPFDNLHTANPNDNGTIRTDIGFQQTTNPAVQMRPRTIEESLPYLSTTTTQVRFGLIGADPGTPTPLSLSLPTVTVTQGGFAPQPPPAQNTPVNALDSRIFSSVVLQDEEVWGVGHFGSAIKWWRLDAATGATIQQGTIGLSGLKLFFPSIAVDDAGQIVIGMNGSGSTTFISSYAVAGRIENGIATFGDVMQLAAGQTTYAMFDNSGRNRWGDYSTTVIDPTDPNVFWTFQEVANANRFVPELNRVVNNNRAIWITQVFVPEPVFGAMFVFAAMVARRRSKIETKSRRDEETK
jgi:hypothetical protein